MLWRPWADDVPAIVADDPEDDEDGLMENTRADEARFRALRCYYVMEALAASEKVGVYGEG